MYKNINNFINIPSSQTFKSYKQRGIKEEITKEGTKEKQGNEGNEREAKE
jgi:hypothetical protein